MCVQQIFSSENRMYARNKLSFFIHSDSYSYMQILVRLNPLYNDFQTGNTYKTTYGTTVYF